MTVVVLSISFLFTYQRNKMSLLPSALLLALLKVVLLGYLFLTYWLTFEQDIGGARIFLIIGVFPYALVIVFGSYVLVATLIFNTRLLLKRECRTLAHFLPLILATFLVIYWVTRGMIDDLDVPVYIDVWLYAIYGLIGFYLLRFVRYITASILLLLSRPKLNQDYVIVHGSGLINGNVSPLLAGRIDKAIRFYHQQKEVGQSPKLILSGGQGHDEPRPEAVAMAEYAYARGIPKSDTLIEDQSTTTLENLICSKKIMDEDNQGKPYNCIFSTSNYHVLRTGLYARMAGLNIDGIGSKTALYYLPNALIREYIAYVMMNKKRQLFWTGTFFLITALLSLILYLNELN